MNKKGILDKTMHVLVHNSFMFTVAIMGLVHAVLLVTMWISGVAELAWFNVLSVVVYLFCFILCRLGHIMPVYVSVFLEVTVYSSVATSIAGWRSGSYFFLFSIVPIIIYFGCVLFKGSKRWIVFGMLVINFATFVALYLLFADAAPIRLLPDAARKFLVVFSSFAMVFAVIFYNAIYIYSSESERGSLERKNKQLSLDATEDDLTNLLNRRGFLPVIKSYMSDERTKHFCIAFCDLDNFKRINDSYGHDCGDEVLRNVTRLLKREMHGCDVCRWGGEEFIILMRDYDLAVAKEKMEYIRKTIETTPTVFFNKRVSITLTIGVEENKDDYKEPEEIIKVADERMYYGKQHGKNIVIWEDATS